MAPLNLQKYRTWPANATGVDMVSASSAQDFTSVSYGSSTPVAALCTGIGTGTGMGQRVGNRVHVHRVKAKFALQAGDNVNNLRIIFFSWKKRPYVPTVADGVAAIFGGITSGSGQYSAPIDDRIVKVYHDSMHSLFYSPVDGSTATSVSHYQDVSIEFKPNKIVEWDSNSTASGLSSDIYLLMISDSGVVANPGATHGYTQLWYTDSAF